MGVMQHTQSRITLTAEQRQKVEAIAAAVHPLVKAAAPKHDFFATRDCYARYLRAKQWDLRLATKALTATLEWRNSYQPQNLCWADLQAHTDGKLELLSAADRQGRPVLMMRTSIKSPAPPEVQVKMLVYHLETASHAADRAGVERMTWLIDLGGFSVLNSPPLDVIKQTMHILQSHYPERLALGVLVRPSVFFRGLWSMIHGLLDPNTRKKVRFVHNQKELSRTLEELFDLNSIDRAIGGRSPHGFNAATYAARLAAEEAQWKGKQASSTATDGATDFTDLKLMHLSDQYSGSIEIGASAPACL